MKDHLPLWEHFGKIAFLEGKACYDMKILNKKNELFNFLGNCYFCKNIIHLLYASEEGGC